VKRFVQELKIYHEKRNKNAFYAKNINENRLKKLVGENFSPFKKWISPFKNKFPLPKKIEGEKFPQLQNP